MPENAMVRAIWVTLFLAVSPNFVWGQDTSPAASPHADIADADESTGVLDSRSEVHAAIPLEAVESPVVATDVPSVQVEPPSVISHHLLQLSGNFSLVGIAGSSRAFVPWNPLFMPPESPFGLGTETVELQARQSRLSALYQGPEVHGFATGGMLEVYMLADSITSDTYGLLPVVAFGELRNDRWRISGGLQPDLFAPRDPVVIPTVLLGGSGNPGTLRGQLRVERFLLEEKELSSVLQFASSDPITTILVDSSSTPPDAPPNRTAGLTWRRVLPLAWANGRSEVAVVQSVKRNSLFLVLWGRSATRGWCLTCRTWKTLHKLVR
jgi:hypothetical protein